MSKYVDRVDMPIMGTGSLMLNKQPDLDGKTWQKFLTPPVNLIANLIVVSANVTFSPLN